ncbi:MAG: hypothetical protein IPJ65_23765 [Archangiaceae bacterium]|nr:hypothetical protein [Archangiaceae bacterium]
MLPFALALLLHGTPFPLPAVDGKALSVTEKQKTFRLPMRFEKVRAFYDGQLAKEKDVAVKLSGAPGARVLTLSSKRKGDRWTKATVREGELETVIDVTPVVEVSEVEVSGNGSPLVQFVFGRSKEVDKAVEQTKDPLTR